MARTRNWATAACVVWPVIVVCSTVSPARAGDEAAVKPALYDDAPRPKPRVMIDPGHGGLDPGAIGRTRTSEKSIVLAVARQLKAALESRGRYDVRLTRDSDVFIPLTKRVEMSVEAGSDLFISLHADAIDDASLANAIHGASIYTLSDKASDEQARLMAEKENAADLAAGGDVGSGEHADEVKGILFDLMVRETATFSHMFSRDLIGSLSRSGALAREPLRAASFVVLKQTHAPSVLVELGFLSNPAEEQAMAQPGWQHKIAGSIAAAVDTYFERRHAAPRPVPSSNTGSITAGGIATGGLPP